MSYSSFILLQILSVLHISWGVTFSTIYRPIPSILSPTLDLNTPPTPRHATLEAEDKDEDEDENVLQEEDEEPSLELCQPQ